MNLMNSSNTQTIQNTWREWSQIYYIAYAVYSVVVWMHDDVIEQINEYLLWNTVQSKKKKTNSSDEISQGH